MSYSRLNKNYGNYIPLSSDYFMGINPSTITVNNRSQLCSGLDDFTSFLWRGYDAFLNFGAFIINSDDLQFYNGPSFSNEYTNPQFESSSGTLMGINFKTQTLKFKIGVYWINIEDYQKFLKFLDPYEIDYLSFGFNRQYAYLVKLSSISDSTRTIVGKEDNNYMYYTEMTLNWELQGPNCVRAIIPTEWHQDLVGGSLFQPYWQFEDNNNPEYVKETFNKTPLYLSATLQPKTDATTISNNVTITCSIYRLKSSASQVTPPNYNPFSDYELFDNLFNITLDNLTTIFNNTNQSNDATNDILKFTIEYDSETGLLFLGLGNDTRKLLTLTTQSSSGENLVQTFSTKKFFFPECGFNSITIPKSLILITTSNNSSWIISTSETNITTYPRTNVI